jgi:CDP-glycerol glycerophosphotransferase (TagB/SpsB family)
LQVKDAVQEIVRDGYTPIFRIHPVVSSKVSASKSLKAWIKKEWPVCVVHDPRETSLLDSILISDFLLAFESAAVFEFSLANKPSILLDSVALATARISARDGAGSNTPLTFGSYAKFSEYLPKASDSPEREFNGVERLLEILEPGFS